MSEYYLYQGLTETLAIMLGRINWVGVADKSYFANNGETQFMNMSLRNTTLLGTFFPLTAHGIAFAYQPLPNVAITPFVVSSNDQPDVYGSPGGLFSEVTVGTEISLSWEIMDLPGAVRPAFAYGTKDPKALSNGHLILDIIRGSSIPTKDDNWIVNFNFDQYLYVPDHSKGGPKTADFDANKEGVGVFFRFAYTPEDRNLWNMYVSGGIGGRGVIPGRPNDRYGVGVYSLFASDDLKDQLIIGKLGSEWGMEAYYNIAVTPWLQITPDIQYIKSGLPSVNDSVVLGTRVQMYF